MLPYAHAGLAWHMCACVHGGGGDGVGGRTDVPGACCSLLSVRCVMFGVCVCIQCSLSFMLAEPLLRLFYRKRYATSGHTHTRTHTQSQRIMLRDCRPVVFAYARAFVCVVVSLIRTSQLRSILHCRVTIFPIQQRGGDNAEPMCMCVCVCRNSCNIYADVCGPPVPVYTHTHTGADRKRSDRYAL